MTRLRRYDAVTQMPSIAAPASWQLLPLQILVCLGTMLKRDADVAQMARAPLS